MKRYHKYTNSDGEKECFVLVYKEVFDSSECTFCDNLKDFINYRYPESDLPIRILNLAKGNLKRHLKTGRHWKRVREYIKTY